MDPPSGRSDRLGDRLDERGDVVVRGPLEFEHAVDGERRSLLDRLEVLCWDPAELSPGFAGEDLDPEPVRELGLVGPDRSHLWQCVPGDHSFSPSASDCLNWRSFTRKSSSVAAMICAARSAAFCAPSMATVATGTPLGICAVEYRAS